MLVKTDLANVNLLGNIHNCLLPTESLLQAIIIIGLLASFLSKAFISFNFVIGTYKGK